MLIQLTDWIKFVLRVNTGGDENIVKSHPHVKIKSWHLQQIHYSHSAVHHITSSISGNQILIGKVLELWMQKLLQYCIESTSQITCHTLYALCCEYINV